MEDGLSENAVLAIVQDHQGYLWFGTREGLDRYDGYGFTIYSSDPADTTTLSNGFITALYVDRAGTLWVGTFHGGLNRFDPHAGTFTQYRNDPADPTSLSHNRVRAILQDREGVLWIGTHGGGLERFDPQTGAFTHYRHEPNNPSSLSNDIVRAIYEDREGTLWVGTYGGLNALDRSTGTFRHYRHSPLDPRSLSNDFVMAIAEDGDGDLWVGTDEGLNRLDRATGTLARFQHDPADPRSLGGNNVNVLYRDRAGTLWIGTETGGLNRLESGAAGAYAFERYTASDRQPDSLSNNAVRSIYEDAGGVLWIGTYGGGLNKLNPVTVALGHYRHDPDDANSLIDNNVTALLEDRFGGLWIGTFGGLDLFDRANQSFTHYRHDPQDPLSLGDNRVRAIVEDGEGTLWVGTDTALNRFDRAAGSFTHYRHDPDDPYSLPNYQVMALGQDLEGTLWVGTYGGGLSRLDRESGTFTHYRHDPHDPQSLSDNVVLAILQDQGGALWIGTESGGLNRFDPDSATFRSYTARPDDPPSLSHNGVATIYQDRAGRLWVGTLGGGLNRFDRQSETFVRYTDEQGLPGNRVLGIVEDTAGRLWLSTNNGLARLEPDSGALRTYDVRDGLQGNAFNNRACGEGSDGTLFFGGPNGFNLFDPADIRDNPHAPPIVITAFKRFNHVVQSDLPAGAEIELSYQDNFISFEFAALDYAAPEKNQYAYRLEGFDADWVDAGTRRYASYTNLRGGTYTFWVRGSNNDGVWNEQGTMVHITIVPPFWERWWFIGSVVLALAGGTLALYRWRVRSIAARNRELARQVDELRAQVVQSATAAERSRLARELHDAVSQTLFSATLIAEVLPRLWERQPEEGRRRLNELRELTRGALAEMRTLLLELRPAALAEAALADLLRQLGESVTGRARIPVIVGSEGDCDLPPEAKVALYRIAQEALNNVIKHAGARSATVFLACAAEEVRLTIEDDGRGFDPTVAGPEHMGLGIMRERAESIGAHLDIHSSPDEGTCVRAVWRP